MQKILVIDDDDSLRKTIVYALRKNGFKVFEARSGAEGIKLARTRRLDLFLCDLNMEDDGLATLAILRKNPIAADIPFILMTGQAEHTDFSAFNERSDRFLAKPFTITGLLEAIRAALAQNKAKPFESQDSHKIFQRNPDPGSAQHRIKPSREQLEGLSSRLRFLLEEERGRVARAIHDDLTQNLTVLAIEMSFLKNDLDEPAEKLPLKRCRENIKKLSGLVNDLIQSAQRITSELHPKVLDEFGLIAGLEWLTEQFQKATGIRCELRVGSPDIILERHRATEIYRLTEEILSNVAQHADASAASVSVEESDENLILEIKDNGKGITAQQINRPESLGLLSMRERMAYLGGEISITGRPNYGTIITAKTPIKNNRPIL